MSKELPNIEVLFAAFQDFQARNVRTMLGPITRWNDELAQSRADFQTKCEEFGIADKFDWSDING